MKKRHIALLITVIAAIAAVAVYLLKKVFDDTTPEISYAPPAAKKDKYEMCDYQKMK